MKDSEAPKIKILVACHKADPNIRKDDIYMPIQVGKDLHPELDLGFQNDNTGDNISEKNGSYCELTAIYWAWKNLKNVDYIGLCHYRRYFDMDMNSDNITRILSNFDCIIPPKKILSTNILTELASLTSWEDAYIFIDELITNLPDKKDEIYAYFYKNNKFSVCNMFIMKRPDFERYCEFLFAILEGTERRIKFSGYTRLRRVLGYLSEPLLGFWLKINNLKFKQIKLELIQEKISLKTQIISTIRHELAFQILNTTFRKYRNNFHGEWLIPGLKNDGISLNFINEK